MRRVDANFSAFFDLFNVFKTNLWFAILLTFIVNLALGMAVRLMERRYVSNERVAPLRVGLHTLVEKCFYHLAYLSNVSTSNRKGKQFQVQIEIRFVVAK